MALFDYITPPGPPIQAPVKSALDKMAECEYVDRFGADDSPLWIELFIRADRIGGKQFADQLVFIRGAGSKLERNDQFGYTIKPVFGPGAWASEEDYQRERQRLIKYKTQLVDILAELRRLFP